MRNLHYDAIIIGAGPAGLACAIRLGRKKKSVLVVERKAVIGPKTCAGGITYSGLLQRVPSDLIEKTFPSQFITTRYQTIQVSEKEPIVATIGRETLGRHMAQQARDNGVEIFSSTFLTGIQDDSVTLLRSGSKKNCRIHFTNLIGADGSASRVRKHLGLPTKKIGIGVHYQVPGSYQKMEWHLQTNYFHNGYGWIFPHRHSFSIGGYISHKHFSAVVLKKRIIDWAKELGVDLRHQQCRAGLVNYDYQGYDFGNIYLVGDAAGFASALTGEGIYPALLSGEAVAEKITNSSLALPELDRLIKKQRRFRRLTALTSASKFMATVCAEMGSLALRSRIINFKSFEMGA